MECLLHPAEQEQILAARVVDHAAAAGVGEHRLLQIPHLLGVQLPGEGVVPGPGIRGQKHAAVQIGEAGLPAPGVGEGSRLAALAGLQIPVLKPPGQRVQVQPVPVDHQDQGAQQQRRRHQQGDQTN